MNTQSIKLKRQLMRGELLIDIIKYSCCLLFLYAAANKLMDYEKFTVQLGQSPIITSISEFVAWFIPTIEIVISILLIFPRTLLVGLYGFFSLMIMFTTYIIIILNFAAFVPCSCGGILDKMGWTEHLIFNLGFVALSFLGIIVQQHRIK